MPNTSEEQQQATRKAIIEIRKIMLEHQQNYGFHNDFDFINESLCDIEEAAGFQHHDCV